MPNAQTCSGKHAVDLTLQNIAKHHTTIMLNTASHDKLIALSVIPIIFVEWVKHSLV